MPNHRICISAQIKSRAYAMILYASSNLWRRCMETDQETCLSHRHDQRPRRRVLHDRRRRRGRSPPHCVLDADELTLRMGDSVCVYVSAFEWVCMLCDRLTVSQRTNHDFVQICCEKSKNLNSCICLPIQNDLLPNGDRSMCIRWTSNVEKNIL